MNPTQQLATAPAPAEVVFSTAATGVVARALQVVAELGIADAIPDDGAEIDAVAATTGTDPDAINRMLRALASIGIFATDGRRWQHTETSELLRSDHPTSMRSFARVMGLPCTWGFVTDMRFSAATGRSVPSREFDNGFFGYLQAHPDQQVVFNEAMTAKAHGDIAGVLAAVDFSRFATIADIGGGHGHLLRAILDAQPDATGCVFELPHVAPEIATDDRLTVCVGDFFADPLPRADLSVLMHIIHDWSDTEARQILGAVGAAARSGDTLMLIELILPDLPAGAPSPHVLDLIMLVCTGGRERTSAEYEALLDGAGYDLVSIVPTVTGIAAIEARRR